MSVTGIGASTSTARAELLKAQQKLAADLAAKAAAKVIAADKAAVATSATEVDRRRTTGVDLAL
jgi:hypothetical protein